MEHSSDRPKSLHEMLNSYTVDKLTKIGTYLHKVLKDNNIRPKGLKMPSIASKLPSKKADKIRWILQCLRDKALLQHIYEGMGRLDKAALQEAAHGKGWLQWALFEAKYGNTPNIHLDASSGWLNPGQKKQPYTFPPLALFMTKRGMMPPDMRQVIRDFVPRPQKVEAVFMPRLPETISLEQRWEDEYIEVPLVMHSTEPSALSELTTVLRLAGAGKIRVSAKTGKLTKPGANNIIKVLSGGDFYPDAQESYEYDDVQIGHAGIRPFAWAMLLQASGLVKLTDSKLELSRTGKAALKKPAHETLKVIWERWLKYKNFHEMSRIETIKGQKSGKRPLYAAAPSRAQIGKALRNLKKGKWMETEDFFTFLIAKGHRFDVVRDEWALYIGDRDHGTLGYDNVTWSHVNGRFARVLLLEYAATLGLIDVALVPPWGAVTDHGDLWGAEELPCLSRYDGLYAFRLNALGAWILGKAKKYEPEFLDTPRFRILPNLEISLLTDACSPPDHLFLTHFCDKLSEQSWQIRMPNLLTAVEEGIEISSIITFLEERIKGPLPQAVTEFFEDASDRANMVQDMGEARLVKCKDKAVAQSIADDLSQRKLCMLAGDDCLVVPKGKGAAFKRELRKLGYVLGL